MSRFEAVSFILALMAFLACFAQYLETARTREEKEEFAGALNQKWRGTNEMPTPQGIFRVVFASLRSIHAKAFGHTIPSARFFVASFIATTFSLTASFVLWSLAVPDTLGPAAFLIDSVGGTLIFAISIVSSYAIGAVTAAQTRFFLDLFRTQTTAFRFVLLAYCDLVLTLTLFVLIFAIVGVIGALLVDERLVKEVPVRVARNGVAGISVRWAWSSDRSYLDYFQPRSDVSFSTFEKSFPSSGSAVQVIDEIFAPVANIKMTHLPDWRTLPSTCDDDKPGARHCSLRFNYVASVRPAFERRDIPVLYSSAVHNVLNATSTALMMFATPSSSPALVVMDMAGVHGTAYYSKLRPKLPRDDSVVARHTAELASSLMWQSNPLIAAPVPFTPFVATVLMFPLLSYFIAVGFKIMTIVHLILNRAVGYSKFTVNPRAPYMQLFLYAAIPVGAVIYGILMM